ncbi:hypothetical protein [Ekhidna sp.]
MSRKKLVFVCYVCLISHGLLAQEKKNFQNLEFTINIDDEVVIPSIAYEYYFQVGKKGKLFIGPGIRMFGVSSGDDWRFAQTNAPEDNFKDGDPNVNAFIADETRIAALNLGIYFLYRFKRFEVGLNTDLVGFTINESVSGTFENASNGSLTRVENVRAQQFVLFPFDGSYNTEIIWAGYQISERSLLKTGITFSDYKYEISKDKLPGVEQEKNAYERIFTTITIGYNYRF